MTDRVPDSFVTCCSLTPNKHVDHVIWYVKNEDQRTGTHHRLAIIGDGKERCNLENLAHNLGVWVVFFGRLPQKEIAKIYWNCETFLMFSYPEGYCLSIDEAKLCGCRTVVTDGDGKMEHADVVLPRPDPKKLRRIMKGYQPWESLALDETPFWKRIDWVGVLIALGVLAVVGFMLLPVFLLGF